MDEELTGLLDQLNAEGAIAALGDEELAGALEDLQAAAEGIDPATASAEQVEQLGRIADTVDAVRSETTQRAEAATQRATDAAERLARIRGENGETEATEGEGAEGETSATGEAVEGETAEPLPVAAAAATQVRPAPRPSVARLAARRPAQHAPRPSQPNGERIGLRSITAAAGAPNHQVGQVLTMEQVAEAIVDAALGMRRTVGDGGFRPVHVASFNMQFPESRRLHESDVELNRRRFDAVMSPANFVRPTSQGLTASGGFCAPLEVDYSVPTIASDARPLRDSGATPVFQGGGRRGGIRFMESPQLGDYTSGVSAWTDVTDANPGISTKPCAVIACGDEIEAKTEALPKCITIGNFFDRTYPEMVQAVLAILNADAARFAEERHISTMATPGPHVRAYTAPELLGSTRQILSIIDRARAAYEYIFRTSENVPWRVTLPRWAQEMTATDLAREIPGASAERLATSDLFMQELLARRNVNVTWLMDGLSSQRWPYLPSGNTLMGWPDLVAMDFYPEGSWAALDGGMLDLGIVRSPDLNATNDLQIWSESFENVFWRGPGDSWHITADVCPDGSTSAPVDIDPCTTGS